MGSSSSVTLSFMLLLLLLSVSVSSAEEEGEEEAPCFSAQQIVPDIQSEVLGISSAGRLQNAPEKNTGIQVPEQTGMGGGVVVISLLKQQVPPLGQYLSLSISSQSKAKRGATQVPSQSSIGRAVVVVVEVVVVVVVVVDGGFVV